MNESKLRGSGIEITTLRRRSYGTAWMEDGVSYDLSRVTALSFSGETAMSILRRQNFCKNIFASAAGS
jgi:hypothetical protein